MRTSIYHGKDAELLLRHDRFVWWLEGSWGGRELFSQSFGTVSEAHHAFDTKALTFTTDTIGEGS